jgi:hypothetical protein
MIAGNHRHLDSRTPARLDRLGDLGARRIFDVEKGQEAPA